MTKSFFANFQKPFKNSCGLCGQTVNSLWSPHRRPSMQEYVLNMYKMRGGIFQAGSACIGVWQSSSDGYQRIEPLLIHTEEMAATHSHQRPADNLPPFPYQLEFCQKDQWGILEPRLLNSHHLRGWEKSPPPLAAQIIAFKIEEYQMWRLMGWLIWIHKLTFSLPFYLL